jgi:hypothetical protein
MKRLLLEPGRLLEPAIHLRSLLGQNIEINGCTVIRFSRYINVLVWICRALVKTFTIKLRERADHALFGGYEECRMSKDVFEL